MSRNFRISLNNLEPLRVADDRTSQHGQTGTLRYIPGSTIRGYVMSMLAQNEESFERWKSSFFSGKIKFLNAYLAVDGKNLIPSLKGFYEDKTEVNKQTNKKEIQNVLETEVQPGFKRAGLGAYCAVQGDTICYASVELSEDININNGRSLAEANPNEDNRNIYRSQYICKNQNFVGYVVIADDIEQELVLKVTELLEGLVYIGNRRTGGYGACECTCEELKESYPYASVRTQKDGREFYMVLLSNLAMRSEIGELVGLNLEEIARRLGCGKLCISRCATSTAQVYGYNRVWKGTIPSANMYEAGSVFRLVSDQVISQEKFREVEEEGLGIRVAEGFGQVAFMSDFGSLKWKSPIEKHTIQLEQMPINERQKKLVSEDHKLVARGLLQHRIERGIEKYIIDHADELSKITSSQLGTIASMCIRYQYNPEIAESQLGSFVGHSKEKKEAYKKHDGKQKADSFHRYLDKMLETDLYELLGVSGNIMGIPAEKLLEQDEKTKYKLQLMERQIRYKNREEKHHD